MNVLIFGGLGKTAKPIIDLLDSKNHKITIFDIASANSYAQKENVKFIHGDICDVDAVNRAMLGIDVVMHLAVNVSDIQNDETTFNTNVYGTYNIFQGALKNNVSKILIASSAPVHMLEALTEADDMVAEYICSSGEDFAYDLTKNIQEMIAEQFSRTYSMNCLVLRLGHVVDGKNKTDLSGNPLSDVSYCKGGWVCRYDVARAFVKATNMNITGFHKINIIGSTQAADLFHASFSKELIGFECEEKFIEY